MTARSPEARLEAAAVKWGPHPMGWLVPPLGRVAWWRRERRRHLRELEAVFGPLGEDARVAFFAELRKGQSVDEDAGGYLLRCYRAMLGLPVQPPYTYSEAAADLLRDAMADPAPASDGTPLAERAGFQQVPADQSTLAKEFSDLCRRHGFYGGVMVSFFRDGSDDRVGVNSSGIDDRWGAEMERLGDRILVAIDDGQFDPAAGGGDDAG